jgi:hypothetical protein
LYVKELWKEAGDALRGDDMDVLVVGISIVEALIPLEDQGRRAPGFGA